MPKRKNIRKITLAVLLIALVILPSLTATHDTIPTQRIDTLILKIRGGRGYHMIVKNFRNETFIAYFNATFHSMCDNETRHHRGGFTCVPYSITEAEKSVDYLFSDISVTLTVDGKNLTRTGIVFFKIVIFFR